MAEADLQTFTSIMDALVRISSNMKSMERELQCPVCKEMVKQPILLPCQHSVCLLCASEVLVQNGYPAPDLPPEPKSPASTPNTRSPRQARRPAPKVDRIDRVLRPGYGTYPGRRRKDGPPPPMLFPCPPCGKDVELGERGLAECLRNLTLERIVERYRHTVSLGTVAIMCQFCKPPQSLEATKGCADCRSNFCNECFKLYHPWGTPRAQHEHVLPTLNFRPKVLTCPEHEQERLHFFCKSCQRLLCPLCKLRRIHAGHKVTPVANVCQALKEKITKVINYILANQETVQAQITQLENAIMQTEMNGAGALEQLTQCVRELGAALAERQGALAQAVEGARLRRSEALSAQVTEKQSMLENAGLLAFSQELLKETDPPCFVQAARLTHNRLLKTIENLQCFSLSADPSFRHFQVDISRELKMLNSLEFIKAPLAPVIDTQRTLAYDQLFLCWRLPQDSAPAWHFSVEFRRREGGPGGVWGGVRDPGRGAGGGGGHWGWQRLEEVSGTSTVIDRLEMDSVYVLRVRGCNKAGFGEYSEEVYLHTPPAPECNRYYLLSSLTLFISTYFLECVLGTCCFPLSPFFPLSIPCSPFSSLRLSCAFLSLCSLLPLLPMCCLPEPPGQFPTACVSCLPYLNPPLPMPIPYLPPSPTLSSCFLSSVPSCLLLPLCFLCPLPSLYSPSPCLFPSPSSTPTPPSSPSLFSSLFFSPHLFPIPSPIPLCFPVPIPTSLLFPFVFLLIPFPVLIPVPPIPVPVPIPVPPIPVPVPIPVPPIPFPVLIPVPPIPFPAPIPVPPIPFPVPPSAEFLPGLTLGPPL
ncbi:tripartite motif-containing protein 46 isoform X1 [Anguilla anguilla]|uniref:tripartite motif-containing protein 46 isoform X1 n=1 Tax=Anguilla anguilla TaxID=7936 RepID=UPI0015AE0ED4|nr:tripartite motif-containing protein 46 isoform X1 [Anguilla anguilla]